jgi:hypothetical protein
MARGGEVEFNDAFFDELGSSSAIVALCVGVAETAAGIMRSTAPTATGDYAAGFVVSLRQAGHRTVAVVENEDPKTLLIEAQKGIMARALKKAARS